MLHSVGVIFNVHNYYKDHICIFQISNSLQLTIWGTTKIDKSICSTK